MAEKQKRQTDREGRTHISVNGGSADTFFSNVLNNAHLTWYVQLIWQCHANQCECMFLFRFRDRENPAHLARPISFFFVSPLHFCAFQYKCHDAEHFIDWCENFVNCIPMFVMSINHNVCLNIYKKRERIKQIRNNKLWANSEIKFDENTTNALSLSCFYLFCLSICVPVPYDGTNKIVYGLNLWNESIKMLRLIDLHCYVSNMNVKNKFTSNRFSQCESSS